MAREDGRIWLRISCLRLQHGEPRPQRCHRKLLFDDIFKNISEMLAVSVW